MVRPVRLPVSRLDPRRPCARLDRQAVDAHLDDVNQTDLVRRHGVYLVPAVGNNVVGDSTHYRALGRLALDGRACSVDHGGAVVERVAIGGRGEREAIDLTDLAIIIRRGRRGRYLLWL